MARRRGDPLAKGAWAPAPHGGSCLVCGSPELQQGSRRYCSDRCQVLHHLSRRRGAPDVPRETTCEICGATIDLFVTGKAGRKRRVDTRKCRDCERLRHLRAVQAGLLSVAQVRAMGNDCALCGEKVEWTAPSRSARRPSIDHITPTGCGGTGDLANLQLTHAGCNRKKNMGTVRKAPQSFYWTRDWRRLSKQVRCEEPNCRQCGAPSFATDHIIAIADDGPIWDRANLQALCRSCHMRKSEREYRARCRAIA